MSNVLVSRRGARVSLVLAAVILGVLLVAFGSAVAPPRGDNLPNDSESARVAKTLAAFPQDADSPVVLLATGAGTLSEPELDAFQQLARELDPKATPVMVSEDQEAAIISLPMPTTGNPTLITDQIHAWREQIAAQDVDGLNVRVTGGPAFAADIASSFSGANIKLLLTTIGVVALLLLITYRSPILWLAPLAVVALTDQLAASLTRQLADSYSLHFDSGIVSVLVFGAGTNYAMLLISRYREELGTTTNHREALARAWRASLPAILASNLTIVLALCTLLTATLPQTRDLGIASSVGLFLALLGVVLVLPPVLAVCGPRLFWPFVPTPNRTTDPTAGVWGRIARRSLRRPAITLAAGLIILGFLALPLTSMRVGLSQAESFRVPAESAAALKAMTTHFPAGSTEPLDVTAPTAKSEHIEMALGGNPHVAAFKVVATHQGIAHWSVVTDAAPGTAAATGVVKSLRTELGLIDPNAMVGGSMAQEVDINHAAETDFWLIAPMILMVSLVVLILLLQSIVKPIALLIVNAASAAAAIGIGSLVSRHLFGVTGVDGQLPLLAFLFLVALGVDYTMFLSHRIEHEARAHGTREGTVRGLATTGTVITSAGIVLAGVFAALATLPLMILGQLGVIVGLGVLLDTLLVRTLVVPALFTVLGNAEPATLVSPDHLERVELRV
jgi:RND superfamily putative drug exporter